MIHLKKRLIIFTFTAFIALLIILVPAWLSYPLDLKKEIAFNQAIPTEPQVVSTLKPLPKLQWHSFQNISTTLYWLQSSKNYSNNKASLYTQQIQALGYTTQKFIVPETQQYYYLVGPFLNLNDAALALKQLQNRYHYDVVLSTEKPDLHNLLER